MFIKHIWFRPPTGFQFSMSLRFFKLISLHISCILLLFVNLLLLPYPLSPAYTISLRLLSCHSNLSVFYPPFPITLKLGFKRAKTCFAPFAARVKKTKPPCKRSREKSRACLVWGGMHKLVGVHLFWSLRNEDQDLTLNRKLFSSLTCFSR